MVVKKLNDQNNLTKTCYSGCQKTLFDQISKQSEHNKQNDRQNSNANQHDHVRNVIVVSLDCTLGPNLSIISMNETISIYLYIQEIHNNLVCILYIWFPDNFACKYMLHCHHKIFPLSQNCHIHSLEMMKYSK